MAFTPTSFNLIVGSIAGGAIRIFSYETEDSRATVLDAGYITNASGRKAELGDMVIVYDRSGNDPYVCRVDSVTNDAATLVMAGGGERIGEFNLSTEGGIYPDTGEDLYTVLQAAIDDHVGWDIIAPEGTWLTSQELKLPSGTTIRGTSKTGTIFKLRDGATAAQNVFTNVLNDRGVTPGYNTGNTDIVVKNLTVDGNSGRSGAGSVGAHTAGCGIGFARVSHVVLENVHVRDCIKHCFDIAAIKYNVSGDSPTSYQDGPSEYVTLINCSGTNSGDDIITTHFSNHITIINPYCYGSGGQLVATNSNGIEIDDGSRYVTIIGGLSKLCVRGIEVKAHDYAPAARNVTVIGLTCESNVRNFEVRHVGFRLDGETVSGSAKDVTFIGCTSITPTKRDGLGTSPRALAIHSYDNVTVRDFTVQGAGDLTTSGDGEDVQYTEEVLFSAVDAGADTITVASNVDRWYTGQPFRYDQGATPIGGLTNGTFYYSIYIDATTIKVAATLTDALAGTEIDLTSQGSGTHTLTQLANPLMVGIHFKAKNITLDGIHFRDVVGAAELIRFTGSCRGTITIKNITASDCEGIVVSGSGSVPGVVIDGVKADTTVSPTPEAIVRMTYRQTTVPYVLQNVDGTGYAHKRQIGTPSTNYVGDAVEILGDRLHISDQTEGATNATKGVLYKLTSGGRDYVAIYAGAAGTAAGGWAAFAGTTDGSFPSTARLGVDTFTGISVGAAATTLTLASGVTVRSGTGSPEGVVTASVSAHFHRTDGGAITSLYVKETGTGNTGWVAK